MNRIEKEAAAYFELQSFSIYNLKFRLYNKPVEKETDIMINKWQITIPELSGEEKRNVFFDSDATYGKCWGMK